LELSPFTKRDWRFAGDSRSNEMKLITRNRDIVTRMIIIHESKRDIIYGAFRTPGARERARISRPAQTNNEADNNTSISMGPARINAAVLIARGRSRTNSRTRTLFPRKQLGAPPSRRVVSNIRDMNNSIDFALRLDINRYESPLQMHRPLAIEFARNAPSTLALKKAFRMLLADGSRHEKSSFAYSLHEYATREERATRRRRNRAEEDSRSRDRGPWTSLWLRATSNP